MITALKRWHVRGFENSMHVLLTTQYVLTTALHPEADTHRAFLNYTTARLFAPCRS